MKKYAALFSSLMLSAVVLYAAPTATPAPAQKPAVAEDMCSKLSAEEQKFAMTLDSSSKTAFCGKFSAEQRDAAMKMVGKPDATGMAYTPVTAVTKVAKDNNIMMMAPAPSAQPVKPSNGCGIQQ